MNSVEGISSIVPDPVEMSTDTVARLNREGLKNEYLPLAIVDECRQAIAKMPEGKSGVVIGSGPNTDLWKSRGWKTLDIDPQYEADYTWDANWLESVIPGGTLDYIFAEAIRFDVMGLEGVGRGRLLNQANAVLKTGGKLIIKTAHKEGSSTSTLPDRKQYEQQLQKHGFAGVSVLEPIRYLSADGVKLEQGVTYYGEKVISGFEDFDSKPI